MKCYQKILRIFSSFRLNCVINQYLKIIFWQQIFTFNNIQSSSFLYYQRQAEMLPEERTCTCGINKREKKQKKLILDKTQISEIGMRYYVI